MKCQISLLLCYSEWQIEIFEKSVNIYVWLQQNTIMNKFLLKKNFKNFLQ